MSLDSGMFLTDVFRFKTEAAKIYCLSLAYQNSIVFIRERMFTWQTQFVHMSVGRQILWRYSLPSSMKSFEMVGSKHAMIADSAGDLLVMQLQTRSAREIHLFKNQFTFQRCSKSLEVLYFSETGLTLLIKNHDWGKFTLNYYYLSDLLDGKAPYFKKTVEKGNGPIVKMDNFSKVVWLDSNLNEYRLCVFSLNNPNQKVERIRISLQGYRLVNSLVCAIFDTQIVVFSQSRKRDHSSPFINSQQLISISLKYNQQLLLDGNNSTISIKTLDSANLLPLELTFQESEYLLSKQHQKRVFNLGKTMAIVSTPHSEGETNEILFVNASSKDIQLIKNQNYLAMNYMVPSWKNDVFLQYGMEGSELVVEYTYVGLPPLHYVFMHLLMGIDDEFDDDLLEDAVELMVEEQQ